MDFKQRQTTNTPQWRRGNDSKRISASTRRDDPAASTRAQRGSDVDSKAPGTAQVGNAAYQIPTLYEQYMANYNEYMRKQKEHEEECRKYNEQQHMLLTQMYAHHPPVLPAGGEGVFPRPCGPMLDMPRCQTNLSQRRSLPEMGYPCQPYAPNTWYPSNGFNRPPAGGGLNTRAGFSYPPMAPTGYAPGCNPAIRSPPPMPNGVVCAPVRPLPPCAPGYNANMPCVPSQAPIVEMSPSGQHVTLNYATGRPMM